MTELKNFQKDLVNNVDEQRNFVLAENSSESETSDSEHDEIRIRAPRASKKSKIDEMIMHELVNQQQKMLKLQRKLSKVEREVDREEIQTRYLKLDLNNKEVELSDLRERVVKLLEREQFSRLENLIWRLVLIIYIAWKIIG